MNKITVSNKINGHRHWNDTFHCEILEDNEKELKVLINNELVRNIKKSKIVNNQPIDIDKNKG